MDHYGNNHFNSWADGSAGYKSYYKLTLLKNRHVPVVAYYAGCLKLQCVAKVYARLGIPW